MSETVVRVENLGKRYFIGHQRSGDLRQTFRQSIKGLMNKGSSHREEFWALRDLNFEIRRGEVVGIIGRNGAGKSTLLKILSRITDPTTGRFEINGRVSSLLEVGTGFHFELTGRENIFLNGTILGMRRAEIKNKFDEIVAFSGVENFLDTPVKHYSSGMRVRLAFSIAAHLEPEILIVDEVLAVGDAEFQKKCMGKMNEVSKTEGRTILFVSHNLAAMENLCETGILLSAGRIKASSQINRVIKEYLEFNVDSERVFNRMPGKGSGIIRFTKAEIGTVENQNEPQFGLSGVPFHCDLKISLRLESETTFSSQIFIAITIFDANGVRISTLDNLYLNKPFYFSGRVLDIFCKVKKFNLNPGLYYCSLWCSDGFETIELIDHAIKFEVLDNNHLGAGKCQSASRHGAIYLDQEWSEN